MQKRLRKVCESSSCQVLVNGMVVVACLSILNDVNYPEFELFCTLFFSVEVSLKIYALTPRVFFQDLFCIVDFLVTVVDIVIMIILAGAAGQSYAKAGRAFRGLRILRILRAVKMLQDMGDCGDMIRYPNWC